MVKFCKLAYQEGNMRHIIPLMIVLSLLFACAPKEAAVPEAIISDEMTRPISPDVDSDVTDEMTRPISPEIENSDVEIDYGQIVWNSLYDCFLSFVTESNEANTFISQNGTRIRIIEQDKYEGERLTEADKANGIVWQGNKWINLIYINEESGEWKEEKLYFKYFRLYEDGRITLLSAMSGTWKEFSCDAVGYIGGKILFE